MDALVECDYEWKEKHKVFWNPKINRSIKTSGLDIFTGESLRKLYTSSWQYPEWWKYKDIRATSARFVFYSMLTFFGSIVSFFFLDWRISLLVLVVSLIVWLVADIVRHKASVKMEKIDGTNKMLGDLKWCRNCKHFKKVRGFEKHLWRSEAIKEMTDFPCKISDSTRDTWVSYFQLPPEKRAMYPKDCASWVKK